MNFKKQILFCFSWIWLTKFSNKIRKLLMIEDVSLISKFYHYINELIMIKQSIVCVLQFNDIIIVFMKFMIFHHKVRIVKLIYTNEKVAESQWIYKLHVKSILHIDIRFFMLTCNFKEFNDVFKKWKSDDFSQFNAVDTFLHIMISLRHLTIASCFLLLRLEMVRFQTEPIDPDPDSDFKSNRIVCQEIKSLKFRIGSISLKLKSIEFDKKEYEEILLISSLSCVANKYIYICMSCT